MHTCRVLVSHALCGYVQRMAAALAEKGAAFDGLTVDMSRKPAWFLAISALGRTRVPKTGNTAFLEAAASYGPGRARAPSRLDRLCRGMP